MMTPTRVSALLLLPAVLGAAPLARAQVATGELARQLVTEGIEAAKEKNWVEARDRFERAYAIQPLPLTLFNLATAQEKTGLLVEADRSYRIFLRETSEGQHDAFRAAAADRRASLEARIAFLRIEARNLAATDVLRVGDQEMAHAVLGRPLPANPGQVRVTVARDGELIARRTVMLEEGASQQVTLQLPAFVPPVTELPAASAAGTADSRRSIAMEAPRDEDEGGGVLSSGWFWVAVGVAVAAGAGVGVYYGALRPDDPYASDLEAISLTGR